MRSYFGERSEAAPRISDLGRFYSSPLGNLDLTPFGSTAT
jgi:hypothetical protein